MVRVGVACPYLNSIGFVVDYADLAPVGQWIAHNFDHRDLNIAFPLINPTAEHLAALIGQWMENNLVLPEDAEITVAVSETPKTWATWTD